MSQPIDEADMRVLARIAGIELDDERLGGVAAVLDSVAEAVAGFSTLPLDDISPAFTFLPEWER